MLDEYVPVGGRSFKVTSARGFKPGDTVIVRRIGNQAWIDAIGMNTDSPGGRWQPFNSTWTGSSSTYRTTPSPSTPRSPARSRSAGVAARSSDTMTWPDRTRRDREPPRHLGVRSHRADESLRKHGPRGLVAEEYYADENHYGNFVTFDNLKHGWVRNATALHFVNSMVGTLAGSKWITVQDCVSREPISQRRGGRRFTFALRGQLALVQRCLSDKGRHSFMMGRPSGSANVFLDCKATSPYSSSEPHENWASGGVYDNVQAPLTARFWKNISIGWAGANTVFWNCEGSFLVQKPPTAQNYTLVTSASIPSYSTSRFRTPRRRTAHRIARPARHAAQPVSDATPRAARRPRPAPTSPPRSTRLTVLTRRTFLSRMGVAGTLAAAAPWRLPLGYTQTRGPARAFLRGVPGRADFDRRLLGSFLEHLGRAVYTGVYAPGSRHADAKGFRTDVAREVRELGVPIVRYPGGNFVSGYNWLDGVGPKAQRPTVLERAWNSLESNQFGTNEFIEWCAMVGAEPLLDELRHRLGRLAVASSVCQPLAHPLERASAPRLHRATSLLCLGNEMEGPWQIGHSIARIRSQALTRQAMRSSLPAAAHRLRISGTSCRRISPGTGKSSRNATTRGRHSLTPTRQHEEWRANSTGAVPRDESGHGSPHH